jgi:hypothetical protein
MILTNCPVLGCTGGIEVSQSGEFDSVRRGKVVQHSFDDELAETVRGKRAGLGFVMDREPSGRPEDGRCTGKYNSLHTGGEHGVKEAECPDNIDIVVPAGIFDGLSDERQSGAMDDRVDAIFSQHSR